ncbi:MAG: DUF1684 domain-containing protein [Sphingobacteriales bacterium]|nr:MAG: DUF1684 domain-containing protein [Sphingobacteriales bacterium]
MNLYGIVAVSGKPGLWKALAQNKTGFILESLDEQKLKLVANLSTAKLAALDEITIFGLDEDIKLKDIFEGNDLDFFNETLLRREISIDGKSFKLNIYQSQDLKKIEKYKNSLFLPFTDLTSGVESYGGGRYVDLEIPEGELIPIDFNTAYNPYCAYNHKYSCPIPPQENDLAIEIKAGVKKFKK